MTRNRSQNQQWWRSARGEWYVAVQLLLFALFTFGPESTARIPRWHGPIQQFVAQPLGAILTLCGALLFLAGIIYLGRNLAVVPYPKAGSELVTHDRIDSCATQSIAASLSAHWAGPCGKAASFYVCWGSRYNV